jgi:hypothetical protein
VKKNHSLFLSSIQKRNDNGEGIVGRTLSSVLFVVYHNGTCIIIIMEGGQSKHDDRSWYGPQCNAAHDENSRTSSIGQKGNVFL